MENTLSIVMVMVSPLECPKDANDEVKSLKGRRRRLYSKGKKMHFSEAFTIEGEAVILIDIDLC